jgi:acetoin utilization deacetylase AcuC-like enzyme
MATAYISHPECLKHRMNPYHPERPERLRAVEDALIEGGLMEWLRPYTASEVTQEQLLRVHDADYIERLRSLSPLSGLVALDEDTALGPHTLPAAEVAAGAAVLATDLVMRGEVDNAFCAVRPPGHHAERDRAMGFCFFNNAAIGVAHALALHGLSRVAVVDFDVHHGNGTERIFRNEKRVLLLSSYQHPFYPYTEIDPDQSNVVRAPLGAGSGSAEFRGAVADLVLPALDAFRPEMIFISAGFDAHGEDDMSELYLTDDDYGWITSEVMGAANRHASGRVVSVLEGGYDLSSLGRSVAMHIRGLMGLNQTGWRGKPTM